MDNLTEESLIAAINDLYLNTRNLNLPADSHERLLRSALHLQSLVQQVFKPVVAASSTQN